MFVHFINDKGEELVQHFDARKLSVAEVHMLCWSVGYQAIGFCHDTEHNDEPRR